LQDSFSLALLHLKGTNDTSCPTPLSHVPIQNDEDLLEIEDDDMVAPLRPQIFSPYPVQESKITPSSSPFVPTEKKSTKNKADVNLVASPVKKEENGTSSPSEPGNYY